MENQSQSQQSNEQAPASSSKGEKKSPHYQMTSRGSKTKGASYKERYVDKNCPECGHVRAYRDIMKTKVSYSCLKRDCKHRWYEDVGDLRKKFVPKKKN